jgi:hypothetical protein
MKSIPIVVIIFFLLNTISCDNNDRKVKEIVKVSADTLMVAPKIDTVKHFPSLIAFEQSVKVFGHAIIDCAIEMRKSIISACTGFTRK